MTGPHIETLAIGDELLTGQVTDSNSSFVGAELFKEGFQLSRQNVVPDNSIVIESAIREISLRAKAAICFRSLLFWATAISSFDCFTVGLYKVVLRLAKRRVSTTSKSTDTFSLLRLSAAKSTPL